jgi:phosphoserine phosphatase RsbU/P
MTSETLRVLLVEDSKTDAALTLRQLEKAGYKTHWLRVETAEDMYKALQQETWDLVICDFQLPRFNAPAALTTLKKTKLDIPFIVVSGSIGEENAVIMMRVGANDYLMKDNMARLAPAVSRELAEARNRREHRRAQAALRESEERWKFALECAGDGVWDWDMEKGEAAYSRRWREMLGYGEDEPGTTIMEWSHMVHPDDLTDVMTALGQHMEGELPQYSCEMRMLCKDGSYKWILARGMVIAKDSDGKALRMLGTHTDITDRKEAERRKQDNDERFRRQAQIQLAILDALPANIVLLDSEGVIVAVNDAWKRFSGAGLLQTQGYGVGDNYLEACDKAQGDAAKIAGEAAAGIRGVLAGAKKEYAMEYVHADPGGPQWFRLIATPLHEERLDGAVVMHVDITERKAAEEGHRRREKLENSLNVAMQVQQSLLPAQNPAVSHMEVVGRSTYCDATGGDYYDFIDVKSLSRAGLFVAVGDVSGHGVAAALLMATARAVLHANCDLVNELSTLMGRINLVLSKDTRHGRFMTLVLVSLDPEAGSLRWVSAGHDPPFVFHAQTQEFEELTETDLVLGIDPEATYEEYSRTGIGPGDLIFIGTDGIWEMRNEMGKQFGKERLRQILRLNHHQSAYRIADLLDAKLGEHRGDSAAQDDVTYVVIKVTDKAEKLEIAHAGESGVIEGGAI